MKDNDLHAYCELVELGESAMQAYLTRLGKPADVADGTVEGLNFLADQMPGLIVAVRAYAENLGLEWSEVVESGEDFFERHIHRLIESYSGQRPLRPVNLLPLEVQTLLRDVARWEATKRSEGIIQLCRMYGFENVKAARGLLAKLRMSS